MYMWTSRVEGTLKRVKTGDSHVVDLHVSVVGAGEELLRVRGEGEGADGHGVALQGLQGQKVGTRVNGRLCQGTRKWSPILYKSQGDAIRPNK